MSKKDSPVNVNVNVDVKQHQQQTSNFAKAGEQERDASIVTEFLRFLKYNKRWWMLPIFLVLLVLGLIALLTSSAGVATPFIYSLF